MTFSVFVVACLLTAGALERCDGRSTTCRDGDSNEPAAESIQSGSGRRAEGCNSSRVTAQQISQSERSDFLAEHNRVRSLVSPPAADMKMLASSVKDDIIL